MINKLTLILFLAFLWSNSHAQQKREIDIHKYALSNATKPTGQGTGLGLSLSYDLVKAHGGELKVETEEGEGSNSSFNYRVK